MNLYVTLGAEAFHNGVPESAAQNLSHAAAEDWRRGWWQAWNAKQNLDGILARNQYFLELMAAIPECEPPAPKPTLWERLRPWG